MKTTENHRSALLEELEISLDMKITLKKSLATPAILEDCTLKQLTEVDLFLTDRRIELLKKCLISGEMEDF